MLIFFHLPEVTHLPEVSLWTNFRLILAFKYHQVISFIITESLNPIWHLKSFQNNFLWTFVSHLIFLIKELIIDTGSKISLFSPITHLIACLSLQTSKNIELTSILKSSRRLNLLKHSCSLGSISKLLALEYLRKAQNFSSPYSCPVGTKDKCC